MASMQALLERDKERFLHGAAAARSSAEVVRLVEEELGRLLTLYNEEEESDQLKETALTLIEALTSSAGLLDCDGTSTIWSKSEYRPGISKPKRSVWFFIFLLLGIAAAGAGAAAAIILTDSFPPSDEMLITLGLFAGALLLLFLSGLFSARKKEENRQELYAETIPDGEKTYHILLNEVLTVDRILERLRNRETLAAKQALLDEKEGLKKEDILLFSELLEAAYAEEANDYASEVISQIRFYLHKKKIEVIDYDGSNSDLFEKMPGSAERTVRPALVIADSLIRKGLATGE